MSTKENNEVAVEKVTENDKASADAKCDIKGIKRPAEVSTIYLPISTSAVRVRRSSSRYPSRSSRNRQNVASVESKLARSRHRCWSLGSSTSRIDALRDRPPIRAEDFPARLRVSYYASPPSTTGARVLSDERLASRPRDGTSERWRRVESSRAREKRRAGRRLPRRTPYFLCERPRA